MCAYNWPYADFCLLQQTTHYKWADNPYGLNRGTWTPGLYHPKVAFYQTELYPDTRQAENYSLPVGHNSEVISVCGLWVSDSKPHWGWSEWWDSNSRPRDPKSRALAKLSYTRIKMGCFYTPPWRGTLSRRGVPRSSGRDRWVRTTDLTIISRTLWPTELYPVIQGSNTFLQRSGNPTRYFSVEGKCPSIRLFFKKWSFAVRAFNMRNHILWFLYLYIYYNKFFEICQIVVMGHLNHNNEPALFRS